MPKYVIGDKVYDTDKAQLIVTDAKFLIGTRYNILFGKKMALYGTGTIYQTKKGAYFFEHETGVSLLKEEQVKEYLKYHRYKKYAELFGELEEA